MNRRFVVALALPLVALGLQWALWSWLDPFVWFLFFPAVFFSARLGGMAGGTVSTLLSIVLVWYFFMPPPLSWKVTSATHLYSVGLFLGMGYLFGAGEERVRRAKLRASVAHAATQVATQESAQLLSKTQDLEKAQSELQRYEQIVATAGEMLGFVDQERRYVVTNPPYAALLGLTPEAMRGKKIEELIGAVNYAHIAPRMDHAMAGEPQHFISTPTLPNGRSATIEADYQPYRNQGVVQGVVIVLRDITNLKESEVAVKMNEERLRLALEASGAGLWDWDLTTGLAYLSPRHYELTGYRPQDVTPNLDFFKSIVHPEDLESVIQDIQDHLEEKTLACESEYRMVTAGGQIRWVTGRSQVVVRNATGVPQRMIGTITDISERKATETSLRQQAEELGQRNTELQRFNQATVGREMDMIALKQQVNGLSVQLGKTAPYALAFAAHLESTFPEGKP